MAIEITDSNFVELLQNAGDKPVMIHIGNEWSGPSRMMDAVTEDLFNEYAENALICKMDAESSPVMPARFSVRGFPTFIFFKNGLVADHFTGAVSKNVLSATLNALM